MPTVLFKRLPHAGDLPLPSYESSGAAGFDLSAALEEGKTRLLGVGKRTLIPTGFAVEIEAGYEIQVRPRSGLAIKHGITVLNTPGTVDEDYRGEVGVILVNLGDEPFEITRGMRIAQGVVAPVSQATLRETERVSSSARGDRGFGSTGI